MSKKKSKIKNRIREYVNFKGFSNREFNILIGASESFLKSDGGFNVDFLPEIRQKCPDLNFEWLLLNEGNMILRDNQIVEEPESKYETGIDVMLRNEIKRNIELESENKALQETVERLKKDYKEISN